MRINLDDCNTPMPNASDSNKLLSSLAANIRAKYIPNDSEVLSQLWADLLAVTVSLANVLSTHYKAERKRFSSLEVYDMEKRIRACYRPENYDQDGFIIALHAYHLEIYVE